MLVICCGPGHHGDRSSEYTTGPFNILYSSDTRPHLVVTEQDRLVWFTSHTHDPFISAEKITSKVNQISGDFTIKHEVNKRCTELEVKEVGLRPPQGDLYSTFYINAVLCGVVAMEMTLQATKVTFNGSTELHHHLVLEVSMANDSAYNQLVLAYGCQKGEGFYGFGAQYSRFNMKGKVVPMFLSEQGVGRGLEPVTFVLDTLSPGAGMRVPQLIPTSVVWSHLPGLHNLIPLYQGSLHKGTVGYRTRISS